MRKPTRRPRSQSRGGIPAGVAIGGGSGAALDGSSRRAFLQSTAGAAAGAAAFMVVPKAASIALGSHGTNTEPSAVVTKRSGSAPAEPVTAYVHNADRHEVVVMWGQKETTYKDPALVKRLLDATR